MKNSPFSFKEQMSKCVIITGATGFIGPVLCSHLVEEGYEVVALSRNPDKGRDILGSQVELIKWDGRSTEGWAQCADGAFAIINLAGDNIGNGRWTEEKKQRILHSRLNAGKAVVEAVEQAKEKPKVVIQASGISVYGDRGDELCDESTSFGSGFLPDIGQQWEDSTKHVTTFGTRHVIIRSGVVFGKGGGFLPRVLLPFRLFVGGHTGKGAQWYSWIHIEDEVLAIRFLLEKEEAQGAFNLVSPRPVTSRELSKTLGRILKRPSWFPVPAPMLRLLFGEMADELILSGQRGRPKRLLEAGFEFQYPEVETALRDILRSADMGYARV